MANEMKTIDERLKELDEELNIIGIHGKDRIRIKKFFAAQLAEICFETIKMVIKSNKP